MRGTPDDDCNMYEDRVFPGNPELCDGWDNDCEGGVDEDDASLLAQIDDGFACTVDSCNTLGEDAAEILHEADDNACDDGDVCIDYTCNPEALDSDPVTGCVLQIVQGRLCDDSLFCTVDDACNAGGNCEGGGNRDCGVNDPDVCTEMVCDEAENDCVQRNREVNAPCVDGFACTESDVCDGAGACNDTPNSGLCSDGNECTMDQCLVGVGCSNPNEPADTACNTDGKDCTTDKCDGAGACTHPINPGNCLISGTCRAEGVLKPNNDCESCQAAVNNTGWTPLAVNTSCTSDGLDCTNDVCDGASTCTHPINAGTCLISGTCFNNAVLNPQNDCQRCTALPDSNTVWTDRSAGNACGNDLDNDCTNPDTCNGSGVCQPNNAVNGTFCNGLGTQCIRQDICQAGVCDDNEFFPAGTVCGDPTETPCNHANRISGSGKSGSEETADCSCANHSNIGRS